MLCISFFSNSSVFILCYVKQEHVNGPFVCYCEKLHVKSYFSRKIFGKTRLHNKAIPGYVTI